MQLANELALRAASVPRGNPSFDLADHEAWYALRAEAMRQRRDWRATEGLKGPARTWDHWWDHRHLLQRS
jgi:hypothetical protein